MSYMTSMTSYFPYISTAIFNINKLTVTSTQNQLSSGRSRSNADVQQVTVQ